MDEGRTMRDIENNPMAGDVLSNRYWDGNKKRWVIDRTLGGSVVYRYHIKRARYTAQCSLEEWREFCSRAVILEAATTSK